MRSRSHVYNIHSPHPPWFHHFWGRAGAAFRSSSGSATATVGPPIDSILPRPIEKSVSQSLLAKKRKNEMEEKPMDV